jgi:uncharacterized protein involved in exopolysaccharide biosynthesis
VDGLSRTSWQRQQPLSTIAGYFALVRSRAAVITVLTLLGALIGAGLALRLAPEYQAGASIALPTVPTSVILDPEADTPTPTTIDSTAQLLFSTPVVERVATVTHMTNSEVRNGLSVSAYPLSRVLVTSFRAQSASLAVSGADAAAAALIRERQVVLEGRQLKATRELRTYLSSRLLLQANRKAGAYNPVSRRLHDEIAQIDLLQQQAAMDRARILERGAPATSISPHGELQVVTGGMLGFLLGVGYAWWSPGRRRQGLAAD